MITAQEAREKVREIKEAEAHQQRKEIESEIQSEVKKKGSFIWWSSSIVAEIKDELIEAGYKITNESNQKEGICFRISWE